MGVSLLCGFGFAKKEYVYQQFETAESVTSVTVQGRERQRDHQAQTPTTLRWRYGTLPDEEPLYDISVQDGRLVVKARDDVDVDTTDDDGPALVRVRIEGHSMNPWSDRELTVTLPDKQYEQLEAGLAGGHAQGGKVLTQKHSRPLLPQARRRYPMSRRGQLELSSAAGKVILRDTWAQKVEVGAAAGSLQLEGVEADELSVGSAVGGASLKQVTAGDLEIASALGSLKLEDVWADTYTKAGLILHTSGQIQKR